MLSSVDGGIQIGTIVVVAPGDEPAVQRVNEEEVSHSAGLLWRASPVNNAMPIHLRGADLNGADLSGARVGMTLFADTNLRGKPTRRTGPSAAVADLPHQTVGRFEDDFQTELRSLTLWPKGPRRYRSCTRMREQRTGVTGGAGIPISRNGPKRLLRDGHRKRKS